jgi:hypothetical protein
MCRSAIQGAESRRTHGILPYRTDNRVPATHEFTC